MRDEPIVIANLFYKDNITEIKASGPVGLMRGLAREIAYAYPKLEKPPESAETRPK